MIKEIPCDFIGTVIKDNHGNILELRKFEWLKLFYNGSNPTMDIDGKKYVVLQHTMTLGLPDEVVVELFYDYIKRTTVEGGNEVEQS